MLPLTVLNGAGTLPFGATQENVRSFPSMPLPVAPVLNQVLLPSVETI